MTHPDISAVERFGSVYLTEPAVVTGKCAYCEAAVYDDNTDAVESTDGMFCDMDCCCEYYDIRKIYD